MSVRAVRLGWPRGGTAGVQVGKSDDMCCTSQETADGLAVCVPGNCPLYSASDGGDAATVSALLAAGAQVDQPTHDGACPWDPSGLLVALPGAKGHKNYIYNIKDRLKAEGFHWDEQHKLWFTPVYQYQNGFGV